jgi:uncharacterized protein YgiM (DUF1202 family)
MKRRTKALALIALALFSLACFLGRVENANALVYPSNSTSPESDALADAERARPLPTQSFSYVTVGNWRLRAKPSTSSEVLAVIENGKVTVIDSVGSWYKVETNIDGKALMGWIHMGSVGNQ